jgi:hypothetical protein
MPLVTEHTLICGLESSRVQLHSDAKRLFYNKDRANGSENEWETQYDSKYRTWRQKSRHAERDGTAFASIALPAHYSAIISVFDHIKQRLEPSWAIERIIDWGSGTGSGLWLDSSIRLKHSINHLPPGLPSTLSKNPWFRMAKILCKIGRYLTPPLRHIWASTNVRVWLRSANVLFAVSNNQLCILWCLTVFQTWSWVV